MPQHQAVARSLGVVIIVLSVGLTLAPTCVQAQTTIYVRILHEGAVLTNSGLIGEDHEDETLALAVTQSLELAWEPSTGQLTGGRQHGPVSIVMGAGPSSVHLNVALVQNKLLDARIRYFKDVGGVETLYMTVELEGARVVSVKPRAVTNAEASPTSPAHVDVVQLLFEAITWTWVDGGITGQDSWEDPAT